MNKIWITSIVAVAAMVSPVMGQDASAIINNIANQARQDKNRVQAAFIKTIDDQYKDRLAIEMVLNHEFVKTVEYVRQVTLMPEIGDRSKRYELPNLQAALIIHTKGQNKPVPEDLMQIYKNSTMALNQIVLLEEERATRKAHNPHHTDVEKEAEVEKTLISLKSQYDMYEKKADSLKLDQYGIDTQSYNKMVVPVIAKAIEQVKKSFKPQSQVDALNQVLDKLQQ